MSVQLKSGHHKFGIPSSATVMNNRKSEVSQKSKLPSIPRRCASSRGNLPSSSSGSKRFRERDLLEVNANEERMRKKPKDSSKVTVEAEKAEVHKDSIASKEKKLTGRSFKSYYKRLEEKIIPVTEKTATDKSEKLLNFQGKEEHVDSDSSSKKRRRLTKKYVQSYQDTNVSSRVIPVDEEDIGKEKPNVDGGTLPVLSSSLHNAKVIIEESSAKIEHYGDQDDTPSQQKLGLDDIISADSEAGIILNDLPICDKRWEKFVQKEKEEIQRIWKDNISKLEMCKLNKLQRKCDKRWAKLIREQKEQFKKIQQDISKLEKNKKLEAAVIRVIHGNCSTTTDKLYALDCKFVKQMAEINDRKDKKLEDQLAERMAEIEKVVAWMSDVKASILSREGAKYVMPLTEKREENNEIVDDANPVNVSTNTPIEGFGEGDAIELPDAKNFGSGERIFQNLPSSGENVPIEVQPLELHGDMEWPETVANEIDLPDADQLTQPKHFGSAERIFANPPASGERVEMQSLELHKDIPAELAETVDKEIVDIVSPVEFSDDTSTERFGEENAIHLADARIETNGTAIDDPDLDGQVLETLEQTKASQHPRTLLPLQVQEDQDVVSAELQDHGVELVGKVTTSPSDVISPEFVDTATNSLPNIEPQAQEEPAVETQSSSRTEVSTLKIDTVIAEQSSVKLQDQETSVVKDQVTSQIELVDSERVDSAAPAATLELVGTAKTLQSDNKFQDQVEPAIETQSSSRTEVSTSKIIDTVIAEQSSTKLQDHETSVVKDQVTSQIELVDSEGVDTAAPAATLELVGTAKTLQSDNKFQNQVEPAIETQSSSNSEVSTSKTINTVITEQSSTKLQDQETSVVKDQVTSQIELVDSVRVDSAAPAATLELVGTAKTLQSDNEFQDQVEPAIETQSMPGIEVAVSEDLNNTSPMLTSTEQQNEDALVVENRVQLEIEVSNSGVAGNASSVQSNIDGPSIESSEQLQIMPVDSSPSCNQLPSLELESQNHNLGRSSSVAAEFEMLSHASMSQLIEDCQRLSRPETQSFPATRVQTPVSIQDNIAAEAVLSTTEVPDQAVRQLGGGSHLHSHQVPPLNFPSLPSDPFQSELEKICKKIKELEKSHEDMKSGLDSECDKEIKEVFAEIRRKYQLKYEVAHAQFSLERDGLKQNFKKVSMNKILADAFKIQGYPSSSTQRQQHLMRLIGTTPLNQQITSLNGQGMQQLSVPPSMTLDPFTSPIHAAPSVQAAGTQQAFAAQHAPAMYRQIRAINGVNRTSNMWIPCSGENIHSSSPRIRPFIHAAAPYNSTASLLSTFQIPHQQQQQQQHQQQQPLAAPQWPSSSQNPGHLGSLYLPALDWLQRNQLSGYVQGNQRCCAGAATSAINLSDDD